jgi:hypothetical protein
MTQIHDIDIQVPNSAGIDGYNVELIGLMGSENEFDQLRELFSLCETTAVQWVPGRRPIGFDPTSDEINIRYVQWTHGDKPEDGWYLLRSYNTIENESAQGHSWYFIVNMVFLGSTDYLQDGYISKDLEAEINDWGL